MMISNMIRTIAGYFFCIVVVLIGATTAMSQEIVVEKPEKPKSFIGLGPTSILTTGYYGEENIGIDVSFLHNFNKEKPNSYYCINLNYINHKSNSVIEHDYLVTFGALYISDPVASAAPMYSISFCWGVDFGVLYNDNNLHVAYGINTGIVSKIYKNLYFEMMLKTNFSPVDNFTNATLGLLYSF